MAKSDYPRFNLNDKLTQEQLDFFDKNGFIHFKNFISRETVKTFLDSTNEIQKKWIAEDVKIVNGIPIKYGVDENGDKIVQRFAFTSLYSEPLHEFLKNPKFELLYPLLGTTARMGEYEKDGLVVNHYVNTETSNFTKLGWHTDSLRDIFLGHKIMPMLNVGVHLDDFSSENGGLRIIPGSHKQKLRQLLFRKLYFLDHTPDPDEIGITSTAGDLTVHDGRLWHRVAVSPHIGALSRRRVMYVPIVSGAVKLKNEKSKTPFYHHFNKYLR